MPSSAYIQSVAEGGSLAAELVLTGQPSGTVSIAASRSALTPALERETLAHTGVGTEADPIVVTMPMSGHWWFWLTDDNGETGPRYGKIEPDAVGLRSVGIGLRDLILAHKQALDESMVGLVVPQAPSLPDGLRGDPARTPRVAQVIYGPSELQEEWPAVVIDKGSLDEPYIGTCYLRQVTVSFEVSVMHLHRDRRTAHTGVVSALSRRLQEILNQREHDILTLGGVTFSGCGAQEVSVTEGEIEGIGWAAEAMLRWQGQTTRSG